jgi:hypothetical protein
MNGSHEMIVMLDEDPGFDHYALKDRAVKAVKMHADFLLQTSLGYVPGKKGEYIVEIAPGVRFPCSERAFLQSYGPMEHSDCDRRCGIGDRRRPREAPQP